MLYINKEKSINRFDKTNEPVLRCSLPAEIVFETNDSFAGQVKSEDDSMDSFDYDIINPCTGPVYFHDIPGQLRSFMERLLYPYLVYGKEYYSIAPRKMPTAFIYTMNATEEK